MILLFLATEMRGDRVGDWGPIGGIVGLLAIGVFFYVIAGGPTDRGPRK